MSFRDRLKEARIAKGLKQVELSEKIGLSKNAVSNYENGSSNPNVEVLYKIFEVLDVSPNYLFQDEIPTHEVILTNGEKEMVNNYRDLNTLGQKQANDYIKLLLLDDKYLKLPQNIPETEYEMAAYGGKDTKGTISKTKEETTAN